MMYFHQLMANLSVARDSLAATSSGNLIFFGGGIAAGTIIQMQLIFIILKQVTWTTATLSQARTVLAATSSGNLVFFGGGSLVIHLLQMLLIFIILEQVHGQLQH